MRCATRYIVGIILIVPLRLGSRLIFALLHRPPVEISIARSMAIGPRRAAAPEKLCPGAAAMAELFRSPCRVKVPPSNRAFRARRKEPPAGPGWIYEIKHDPCPAGCEARATVHPPWHRFSPPATQRLLPQSRACLCGRARSTARPSSSTRTGSLFLI